MNGLTAKVFRTWRTTKVVREYLEKCEANKKDPEYVKKFCAKMANLQGAEVANHKRKIPVNFDERLAKKEAKLRELELKTQEKIKLGKSVDSYLNRIKKTNFDIELTKQTKEYNLGTSLKSYIDPKVYAKWADNVDFPLEKFNF